MSIRHEHIFVHRIKLSQDRKHLSQGKAKTTSLTWTSTVRVRSTLFFFSNKGWAACNPPVFLYLCCGGNYSTFYSQLASTEHSLLCVRPCNFCSHVAAKAPHQPRRGVLLFSHWAHGSNGDSEREKNTQFHKNKFYDVWHVVFHSFPFIYLLFIN